MTSTEKKHEQFMEKKEITIIGRNFLNKIYSGEIWKRDFSKYLIIHENCIYIFTVFHDFRIYFHSIENPTLPKVVLVFEPETLRELCSDFPKNELKVHYLPYCDEPLKMQTSFETVLSNVRKGFSQKFPRDVDEEIAELRFPVKYVAEMVEKIMTDLFISKTDENRHETHRIVTKYFSDLYEDFQH